MGGTDDPSNLVEISIEKHAELHKQLWEDLGYDEDRLAWRALSGMLGKEEIILESQSIGGKKSFENKLGIHNPSYDRSEVSKANGKKVGEDNVRCKRGMFVDDFDNIENCSKGGKKAVELKTGIYDPEYDRSVIGKMTYELGIGIHGSGYDRHLASSKGGKTMGKKLLEEKRGIFDPNFIQGSQHIGKIYINKDCVVKRVSPENLDEYLNSGWKQGRGKFK